MAGDLNACMSIIRLLALQCQLLKHSATRVVNLTHEEAAAFVRSCNKYAEVINYSPSVNQSVNNFYRSQCSSGYSMVACGARDP